MSYAEQKWTVDQVNKKIENSDTGKDLYIAGVPRGLELKSINSSVFISGAGWVVSIYAFHRSSQYGSAMATITLDEERIYTATATLPWGSSRYDIDANIVLDQNTIVSRDTNSSIAADGNSVIINKPLRFEQNMSAVLTGPGVDYCLVYYILDPSYSGGGAEAP